MVFVYTYAFFSRRFLWRIIQSENANEISLLSLLEKLKLIKFSSSSSLLLTFCFCRLYEKCCTNEDEFLTKVIAHTQKRQRQNFLSLLSLSASTTTEEQLLFIRFETNFSILVALHIRVVINAAVLFLSSSHFENERVGERESREKRGNKYYYEFK